MNFHTAPHTYVSSVHIFVENLERSYDFYTEIIGFKLLDKSENQIRLSVDGNHPLLTIEQPDDVIAKEGRTTGLYHFAILLPNRSELAKAVLHLSKHQWPIGSSDHLVSEAIYLSDPDGNGIELYADRDPSKWQWQDQQIQMTVDPLNFESLLSEANSESTWGGLPSKTLIGHIHLHVAHIEEAERFYRDALGFDIVSRFGGQASFLSTGKYHHHIAINTWAGVGAARPASNQVGLKHFTINYPTEHKRKEAVNELRKLHFTVEESDGLLFTTDPSGNSIILAIN
ncbi:VOC family protein [Bacillus sp. JCM 19034]|uniref:VOC family protein n=1 Tax=Bacillus sp. JCM 19034 TaxID=1481928 RepID=UPI0007829872|nr:VOC family protein [Bacillus sp. JCM 19034]